jgi:hypothetical protein
MHIAQLDTAGLVIRPMRACAKVLKLVAKAMAHEFGSCLETHSRQFKLNAIH